LKKKARFTVPSHVLMVMPVKSNVALVVTAANYSQQLKLEQHYSSPAKPLANGCEQ